MRKLRIGNFLFHYPQPGGTSGTLAGLSAAFARLGHKVFIYCCGKTEVADTRTHPDVELLCFRSDSRNPFQVPRALNERVSHNHDKIDLLLVHGFFNPANITIARAARRACIPYVACPSGLYHHELMRKNRSAKILFGALFEKPYLRNAAAIQVFGGLQERLIHQYAHGHAPIFTVPNGFDPDEVSIDDQAPVHPAAACHGPGPHWLFFGRLDMHTKGLDLLLEALALGLKRGWLPPLLHLKLVGPDWGDGVALKALAKRLGIEGNVTFTGRVDERTKWQVLSSSDLVLLTSRHDAYPRAAVEAMVSGKPVLISTQTSISDTIEDHRIGYTVAPTVDSVLGGLVRAIQTREEWPDMGKRARAIVYEQLLWSQIATRAADVYSDLVGRDRGVVPSSSAFTTA